MNKEMILFSNISSKLNICLSLNNVDCIHSTERQCETRMFQTTEIIWQIMEGIETEVAQHFNF